MLPAHHTSERAFLLPWTSAVLALCGLFLFSSWLAETLSPPISTGAWVLGHDGAEFPAIAGAPIPSRMAWIAPEDGGRFGRMEPGLGTLQPISAPCDCSAPDPPESVYQTYSPVVAAAMLQSDKQTTWYDPAHRFDHLDLRLDLAEMAAYQRSIVTWQNKCLENHYFCGLR